MSVIYDKESGKWRVSFEYSGSRYRKKGFQTKEDAETWELEVRKTLGSIKEKSCIERDTIKNLYGASRAKTLKEIRSIYRKIYDNPHITAGTIFDMVMEDLGLPPRYSDVVNAAKESLGRKANRPSQVLRAKILKRDKSTCQMCGSKAPDVKLHVDHIVPISRGGLTEERNLQVLCEECNLGKRATPPILPECFSS